MNNMKCQVQKHSGKKVIAICMDKECKNQQRLCCILCLIESHNNHQKKLVEIDEINVFIDEESKKQRKYPETCSYGQLQIIQGLEKLNSLIDNLQKIILEKIEIIKQQNLQDYLKKTMNNQQGLEYWNQLLEGILQYSEVDNCLIIQAISKEGELIEADKSYIQIIRQSEERLQSMTNQINTTYMEINVDDQAQICKLATMKIDKDSQTEIDKSVKQKIDKEIQTQNYNPIKIGKLCFSENRKNVDIAIIDQHTIKKTKTSSYAMAYADCGFDPNTQSLKFSFDIQKLTGYIFVGVGNDGNIVPSYILPSYTGSDLGQYMISSDGYTIHHKNNYKTGQLYYSEGDMIHIKYDYLTKILEFRKESDQTKIITMTITDLTKYLYPCAFLKYPNSQVQLIEF